MMHRNNTSFRDASIANWSLAKFGFCLARMQVATLSMAACSWSSNVTQWRSASRPRPSSKSLVESDSSESQDTTLSRSRSAASPSSISSSEPAVSFGNGTFWPCPLRGRWGPLCPLRGRRRGPRRPLRGRRRPTWRPLRGRFVVPGLRPLRGRFVAPHPRPLRGRSVSPCGDEERKC